MSTQVDLGQHIATHGNPRFRRVIIRLIIGIVISIGTYLLADIIPNSITDRFGMVLIVLVIIGPALVLIAVFSLPGAIISLKKGRRISVYENGFILRDGNDSTIVQWTDIDAISSTEQYVRFIVMMGETKYTIKLKQGPDLVLSTANFHRLEELGQMIETRLQRRPI